MTNQNIVLVENDIDDVEILKEVIPLVTISNYNVLNFEGGKEAIEYLLSRSSNDLPCLIILDCNMPGLGCAEVLERIAHQKRYEAIPKYIFSTCASPLHINKCLALGANKYVVKPYSFSEYLPIVKEMIDACTANDNIQQKSLY